LIHINNVKKYFKTVKAVDGVSLEIAKNEFVGLLGPNGAGKTTLMEMLEGIQFPDSGEITIKGMEWKQDAKALRKLLGLSLQETFFIEKLTVAETLRLFASFYGLDEKQCSWALDLINLEEKKKAYVQNLSGGQRQRLALGVALLNQPEVLLLDEPTTGLDPTSRRELWDILHRLRDQLGMTMVLTTHYMEEADFLCERIIIMDHGKVLAEGTVTELLSKNNSEEIIEFRTGKYVLSEHDFPKEALRGAKSIGNDGRWELRVKEISSYVPQLLQFFSEKNISFDSLECRKMTLDDLFLSLTGRSLNE
jgi:ABC-2 type transport system ATP-binding protein